MIAFLISLGIFVVTILSLPFIIAVIHPFFSYIDRYADWAINLVDKVKGKRQ